MSKKKKNSIKIFLKYVHNGNPAINDITLITRPSKQLFYSVKQIWKIDSDKSFFILSTNKGLQTLEGCKKLNIGGEAFLTIN
jgi:small subunit ribosomal protein S8